MILRLWSGWTTIENTAAYDKILNDDIAPGITARGIEGLSGFDVLTRRDDEGGSEREFLTAMWFDDVAAVKEFTGGDPHKSVVPLGARDLLSRYDQHSRHYDLRARQWPKPAT